MHREGSEDASATETADTLARAALANTQEASSAKYRHSMDAGMFTMSAEGEMQFGEGDVAMSMVMDMGMADEGGSMEMVLVDQVMYMNMGELTGEAERPWVQMDLGEEALGSLNFDEMLEQNDPTKTLEMLQETGEIVDTEETMLDGEPATHYTIDVDFAAAMEQYGGAADMDADLAELEGFGIETMRVDLWLNADQLPVRYEMDMSEFMGELAGELSGDAPDSMSMVFEYYDWGQPVDIQAPPADQISDESPF